jgi:hypothetical protein
MDGHFGPVHYSVQHLFRDEQHKILERILASPRDEIYNTLRHITEHYAPLQRFVADLRSPPLKALGMATEIVLNTEMRRQFEGDTLDLERVRSLLAECAATKVTLYSQDLAYALKAHFDRVGEAFVSKLQDMEPLQHFVDAAELARIAPFQSNLWKPQNIYYEMMTTALPKMRRRAAEGNEQAGAWVEKFRVLGEKLGFSEAVLAK